jgi:predicted transcriptional regulator
MKSATLPPLRVTPEMRAAAESVLKDGETLSSFVETSVRQQIHQRRAQKEFIARGLAAREEAKRTGVYYTVEEVMASLDNILEEARQKRNGA